MSAASISSILPLIIQPSVAAMTGMGAFESIT